MKIIYNKFFKFFCKVLLSLCIVVLIFGIVLINSYNNKEHFHQTFAANNIALEQFDLLYLESIVPFLEGTINAEEMESKIKNSDYLDVNYHYIIRMNNKTYTDITDINSVSLINAISYGSHDMWPYTNSSNTIDIYVENYINNELIHSGELYDANQLFIKFNTNFKFLASILFIVLIVTIILSAFILATAGFKEKTKLYISTFDKIYIEIPILGWMFLFELIGFFSYGSKYQTKLLLSFSLLFIILFLGIFIVESFISRIRNKTLTKSTIIGKSFVILKKLLKQIVVDVSSKVIAGTIIAIFIFSEVILLFFLYPDIEFALLLWTLVKVIEYILLMHFYSNVCILRNSAKEIHEGSLDVNINTTQMYGITKETAIYMNEIFEGFDKAIDEKLKSEQLKTELITNVSHDLKTPLTSIINYVDLMKKEEFNNPKLKEYLEIIDKQSMRLKRLTEDVVEASKAATGNIKAELTTINIREIMEQALGEYETKLISKNLDVIFTASDNTYNALADGRLLWRVIDNLLSNVYKYALEGTRLYIDVDETENNVIISVKNISKYQLNISSEELKQRFVRGDASRSTSGNGLGLSIAESLMTIQNGELKLDINGDLFIAKIYLTK